MILLKHFSRVTGVTFFVIIIGSCSEQKLATDQRPSSPSIKDGSVTVSPSTVQTLFNKTVGAPIDSQTGLRWIRNFANVKPANVSTEYIIQANTFKGILSNSSCVGISLYYGADNSGRVNIIPVGIDANGRIITTQSISVQSSTFAWQTAQQWINNYSGKVKAHFFGSNTFNRLLIDQNSPSIRISPALDDSGNSQLLMSNASISDPATYEDKSSPCPPVCAGN